MTAMKRKPERKLEELYALLERNSSFTHCWHEIGFRHEGSIDDTAAKLTKIYVEQRKKKHLSQWRPPRHVLRRLVLDLICESLAKGNGPSPALITLMKLALDLPENHNVGSWPLTAGMRDDRGGADHDMRMAAWMIDMDWLKEHEGYMPLSELARRVEKEMKRPADRKALRQWRDKDQWWSYWKEEGN
jgi:hypothetical protein